MQFRSTPASCAQTILALAVFRFRMKAGAVLRFEGRWLSYLEQSQMSWERRQSALDYAFDRGWIRRVLGSNEFQLTKLGVQAA